MLGGGLISSLIKLLGKVDDAQHYVEQAQYDLEDFAGS